MELLLLLPLLLGVFAFGGLSLTSDSAAPADTDDNLIAGRSASDTISANAGEDLVLAGASADSVSGGPGADVLLGESGADTITGGAGLDVIAGGQGNDVLFGGIDADLLVGGLGDDLLYGGSGNDALSSTSGEDTLYGDSGNDFLSGYDNVLGTTSTQALSNNMILPENDAIDLLADFNAFAAASYGSAYSSQIAGRVNTALTEYDATDLADDALYGGAGNDVLLADFSDTLTGGAGFDRFVLVSDGVDEIVTLTDFNPSEDTLRIIMPANSNAALTLVDGATPAAGVTVLVGGEPVAQLLGLTVAQVPTTVFEVVVRSA